MGLEDRYGRVHDDLRISVTDRCNLRCAYCMPEEPEWFPHEAILSYEEILRLTRILLGRGVRKIRLTGGEPLVRRNLPALVRMLADEPGVEDLSLTTNGVLLSALAGKLAEAGLQRVNVSLDTLDPRLFKTVTRRDALERVLRGIESASDAGLRPIKINTVLLRGLNDDELETLVERGRAQGWEMRFIEFMPLENDGSWQPSKVVSGDEVRKRIEARWPLEPDPRQEPHAPATRYRFKDGGGTLGFIDSVSTPFCDTCSRLRLTSDGKLRVCLYDTAEVDLKTPLRAGASDRELEAIIVGAVLRKGRGGALDILERRVRLPLTRTMQQIGG